MSERIRIDIDEAKLEALMARMDEALAKKDLLMGITPVTPTILKTGDIEETLLKTEIVSQSVDEVLLKAGGLDAILIETQYVQAEIEITEKKALGVKDAFLDLDLPQVDRATRMILLRVPGLREVMRLMYVIKMMQRTLRLEGIRGPVTAGITAAIYVSMALQGLQRRQNTMEARLEALEQRAEQRFITIEEALRGYGELPERYRSTITP